MRAECSVYCRDPTTFGYFIAALSFGRLGRRKEQSGGERYQVRFFLYHRYGSQPKRWITTGAGRLGEDSRNPRHQLQRDIVVAGIEFSHYGAVAIGRELGRKDRHAGESERFGEPAHNAARFLLGAASLVEQQDPSE